MTGPVIVDLPPATVSSPYVGALLESCTTGMHAQARCTLGPEEAGTEQSTAVAIVAWDGSAHPQARIDVGLRFGMPRWRSRVLSFSAEDPEVERWRTVGFAIATIVGEALPPAVNEPSKTNEPSTVPDPKAPDVLLSPSRDARSWLDGAFVVSRGAQGFSPAEGGELRFSHMLGLGRSFVGGALGCSFQRLDPDGISLVRPGASAGGGVALVRYDGLEVIFRVEAAVELFAAASGHGESTRFGFRQGLDAAWMWDPHWGLVAGINAIEMTSSATIDAHGQAIARVSPFDVAGQAGLRIAFR
jgi:hypothetical protein